MTTTRMADTTSMRGYSRSRPRRLRRRRSLALCCCEKSTSGSPWSGSVGQQLVHPGLELGRDAAERQPGRGRRAGAATAADIGPPPPHPPPNPISGPPFRPTRWRLSVGRRPRGTSAVGVHLGQDLGVERGRGEQLGVGAVGHDAAALEQDDPVGQADGRQPVGHDQRGAALHEHAQGVVDLLLHLDVDGAGGIVEHQDGRVDEQGPGDGDALALAPRQRVAALADHGVVALGQVADELVGPGGSRRRLDFGEVGVGTPVGDVVADRHREQERLVEHDADVGPQTLARVRSRTSWPSIENGPAGDVVEAGEQSGHRRLARAGPAHQGHRLARAQVQVEVRRAPAGRPSP